MSDSEIIAEYPQIPYIKTKIGEHDLKRPACLQFCKMNGKFCPFLVQGKIDNTYITRWTDIADKRVEQAKKGNYNYQGSPTQYKVNAQALKVKKQQLKNWNNEEDQQLTAQLSYSIGGFTCWGDASGFQYDVMANNLIGPRGVLQSVYDINQYGVKHNVLKYSQWNSWVDKIQYDYRFGQVSDQNAECILFPNVDNPWMFTQYVYKGLGGSSGKCALNIPEQYVVQPPIYDPKTLKLVNGDYNATHNDHDGKYNGEFTNQELASKTFKKDVKQYRQITSWSDFNKFQLNQVNNSQTVYNTINSNSNYLYSSCDDQGVRLYRASLPVQSVKWGEHGNIPPHTLDMTATQDWLNPNKSVVKFKAVYTANVGSPFYSDYDGVVVWGDNQQGLTGTGRQAFIYEIDSNQFEKSEKFDESNYSSQIYYTYNYQDSATITALDMPYEKRNNGVLLNPDKDMGVGTGEQQFAHRGCSLCYGKGGFLKCKYIETISDETQIEKMKAYFNPEYCLNANEYGDQSNICPKYIFKTTAPQIAHYQTAIQGIYQDNLNPLTTNGLMIGAMGGVAGLSIAAASMANQSDKIVDYITHLGKPKDLTVTYSVKYQPVMSQGSPAKLNKQKYNEFGQGVQIVPGTGKYAFDNTTGFQGGDTNTLGDISTLSFHRFFRSVMHCSSQVNCNSVVGQSQIEGFSLQGKAGGDGECKYYNNGLNADSTIGCPYNCVPKRAVQYCNVAFNMINIIARFKNIYSQLTHRGIWDVDWDSGLFPNDQKLNRYEVIYNSDEIQKQYEDILGQTCYGRDYTKFSEDGSGEAYQNDATKIQWVVFDEWAVAQFTDEIAIIAVKLDEAKNSSDCIPFSFDFGGASLFKSENVPSGFYVFCQFKTKKTQKTIPVPITWDSQLRKVTDKINEDNEELTLKIKTYNILDAYFWYQPLNNKGNVLYDGSHFSFTSSVLPKSQVFGTDENGGDNSGQDNGGDNSGQGNEDLLAKLTPNYDYSQWKLSKNLRQHVDKNGLWFCKLELQFTIPKKNCVIIDNSQKFIGGHHPQYKDYSQIGSEFMQQIISDEDRQGQGMGDTHAGSSGYSTIPQTVNKKGYWINQSGMYIMDERQIGYDQPIANEEKRAVNGGSGPCISFKKSNTQVDGATGKTKPAKVTNGAVFANDPYDLLVNLYPIPTGKDDQGRPTGMNPMIDDPEQDGKKYYVPCYISVPEMLPTRRKAIHCPICDYYLTYKYESVKKCPWCGSDYKIIKGDTGYRFRQMGSGNEDDYAMNGSLMENKRLQAHDKSWKQLCDFLKGSSSEQEESEEEPFTIIKKFFKIYSMGNVDVWAPPGTSLQTSAYFWKHPTHISNALKRQIYHRLGTSNKGDKGGGYKFDKMTASSQLTLGYPQSIGKFEKILPEFAIYKKNDNSNSNIRYSSKNIKYSQNGTPTASEIIGMYNKTMPRHMIPQFYDKKDTDYQDQGIISPYSIIDKEQDALKLISYEQMMVFRNAIQPVIAYSNESYAGQYPTRRASYNLRQSADQPIIYKGRKSVIDSVVLATTDDGVDSYQDYYSGDMVYGIVREHFPSGYTWWFMKQVLGGRVTKHTSGTYHMDDAPGTGEASYGIMSGGSRGLYTRGNRTLAKCAVFIHGLLPLDKQILKAYLIIGSNGIDASKDPIGLSWSGGPAMYHHYHAMIGAKVPEGQNPSAYGKIGQEHANKGNMPHFHGTAGHKQGIYFNQYGKRINNNNPNVVHYSSDDIKFQDESAYRLWGQGSHAVTDDRFVYYDDKFEQMIGNLSGLYDMTFYRNVGAAKKDIKQKQGEKIIGRGYDSSCFPSPAGFKLFNLSSSLSAKDKKFQYIVMDQQSNLVKKYTSAQIWKTTTSKEMQDMLDQHVYQVQFKASDGTLENTTSYIFTQTDSTIYNELIPEHSQSISGYFDMGWSNTKGYISSKPEVDYGAGYTSWDAPVIFQDEGGDGGNGQTNYSGTVNIETNQYGPVERCLDVTEIVKKLYNQRVERDFHCHGGAEFNDVFDFKFYDVKGEMDEDVNIQNKQAGRTSGYILNDDFSYPKLESIVNIPQIDPDGEKYELAEKKVQLLINVQFPIVLKNNRYYYVYTQDSNDEEEEEEEKKLSFSQNDEEEEYLLIQDYETFQKAIEQIFQKVDDLEIQKIANNSLILRSQKKIVISKVSLTDDYMCYRAFGLKQGQYIPGQNRMVEVSNYNLGYHPKNLLYNYNGSTSSGTWYYQIYENKKQFFIIDLLRAPLCIQQKNWRYKGSQTDYSNARCPIESCKANQMGCAVAANMSGKHFDKSVSACPICGTKLDANSPGVFATPGDGIKTYKYDKAFYPDAFINEIYIQPFNCTTSILYKSNKDDVWKSLTTIFYDKNSLDYKFLNNNQSFLIKKIQKSGDGLVKISINQDSKSNNYKLRARYLKIQCESQSYKNLQSLEIVEFRGYQIVVKMKNGNFNNMGEFSFSGYSACISTEKYSTIAGEGTTINYEEWINRDVYYDEQDNNYKSTYGVEAKIISSQIISSSNGELLKISLDRYYNPNEQEQSSTFYISFFANKYLGGIKQLKICGCHYKTQSGQNVQGVQGKPSGERYLTMTDTYDCYKTYLLSNSSKIKLPEVPIQLITVGVGTDDAQQIILSYKQVTNQSNLYWTTQQKTYFSPDISSGITYKKITGGEYCYDCVTGYIYLPTKDGSGDLFIDFEKKLQENQIAFTEKPNRVFISYWSGNGKSVTLTAQAAGHGPSYMLQKNAINTIVSDKYKNGYGPIGKKFCQILNQDKQRISPPASYSWICYNNVPSNLSIQDASRSQNVQGGWNYNAGQFRTPNFIGNQIAGFFNKDEKFTQLFGQNCEGCYGICETQVTFVGRPDSILSGQITVRAPEKTTYNINLGGGKKYKYEQLTGGIKNGIIICSMAPVGTEGRVTKCYSKPKLVIFAKESKKYI